MTSECLRATRSRRIFLRCLAGLLPALSLTDAAARSEEHAARPLPAVQGKLLNLAGAGPTLHAPKKDYRLAGKTSYLFHTLQDKRLLNREVRLEGRELPDGAFEVEMLYTVRDGKLYRVRYYCEVCNIEALEPGDCVCCQQPTDLQEIPVTDPSAKTIITRP